MVVLVGWTVLHERDTPVTLNLLVFLEPRYPQRLGKSTCLIPGYL